MITYDNGKPGPVINNNGINPGQNKGEYKEGCVDEAINNLLPKSLSNYFFFDGERWRDDKTKKEDVKNSINTILGITGLLEMKKHLKDGKESVYKTLSKKIKGSDGEYERLQKEIDRLSNEMNVCDETITDATKKHLEYDNERIYGDEN